jgi:RNA polymerase sigma-70 factor (ECF subfamily)
MTLVLRGGTITAREMPYTLDNNATPRSLFERLRRDPDSKAWREFVDLYSPLLYRYCRLDGLSRSDADDVAQECLAKLVRVMPTFEYDSRRGSFKGLLCTMVRRCIIQRARRRRPERASTAALEAAHEPPKSHTDAWDREWIRHHLQYCLRLVEEELSESTVAAFRLYVLRDWAVEEVCKTLGISANQVYLAKSRVTRRLREEMVARIGNVWA